MPRRAPPRRGKRPAVEDRATTRLAYSTGGGTPPVTKPADPSPPGHPGPRGSGPVRLRLERRASDRVVTVVTGLPGTTAQVESLARELRALCGTGGTARDGEVELQGDQRGKIAAALEARGLRVRR